MGLRLVPLDAERRAEALGLIGDATRPAELLERAATAPHEARGVAAVDDGGALVGFTVHGDVAGAVATGVLLWVTVRPEARRRGVGRALVKRAIDDLRAGGARLVVAELPGSAQHAAAVGLLAACGFRGEGEVADFYRDGVPLLLFGYRLA